MMRRCLLVAAVLSLLWPRCDAACYPSSRRRRALKRGPMRQIPFLNDMLPAPVKSSYFDRRPLQDITGILSSVGVDANNEKLVKMLSALEGKDLVEAAHHAI